MCKLLIQTYDPGKRTDPNIDAQTFRPGDVIAIHSDDHVWGQYDLTPITACVHLPGVDPNDLIQLVSPDAPTTDETLDSSQIQYLPRIRIWWIPSYFTLPATLETTAADFVNNYCVLKDPYPNPDYLA